VSQDEPELTDRRAARLGALLRAADPPVPAMAFPEARIARAARRRAVARWRAAAAVALVAACALGVRPVRAWIVEAARTLWSAAAGGRRAAPRPPAAAGTAGRVTFTPTAGSFVVRVARPQDAGTLTVETTAGASASAEVSGGTAELVVLPDGLAIVNDSGTTGSYVVRVPAAMGRIAVAVGAARPRVLGPAGPGGTWVLDLRGAR